METVFITEMGKLNVDKLGEIASSYDLIESVAMGNDYIKGILRLEDGYFMWINNIEEDEEFIEVYEYVKIPDYIFEEKIINKVIKLSKVKIVKEKFKLPIKYKLLIASYAIAIIVHVFWEFKKRC